MELRSSRSRSKTPFPPAQESFDKELIDKGNHVGQTTIVRSTRRTIRSHEKASSSTSDEYSTTSSKSIRPSKKAVRSEKSVQKLIKTSDYSSEDGENEVTSTRSITRSENNGRSVAANVNSPALKYYLNYKRYWDEVPKTDWTYSQHSKDRVELAPGVIAMPNMSRKTIHSLDSAVYSENTSHKQTNTDVVDYSRYTYNNTENTKRRLFNNNYDDTYVEKRSYSSSSVWSKTKRTVISIYTSILTVVYYIFDVQTSWFARLHNLSSKVMLWDTWILQRSSTVSRDKRRALVALCLIPLLLLGGWWMLSGLGSLIYGAYFNSTSATLVSSEDLPLPIVKKPNLVEENQYSRTGSDININQEDLEMNTNSKIINIVPPSPSEIASSLTSNQLESIAAAIKNSININKEIDTEEIINKILSTPEIKNIVNNYNNIIINQDRDKREASDLNIDVVNNQQRIIDSLKDEINKIREELLALQNTRSDELDNIITELKNENAKNTARLTYQINRCCSKPIINIEGYVHRILTNLLNKPDFLNTQSGFSDWLHKMFVAKQDLEIKLANATQNLDSKYESLITNNGKIIMDEIASKIHGEITTKINENKNNLNLHKREVSVGTISDERIKEIVAQTLAIYDADKTGLVDYAMEPMGGQIITTRCTENFHSGKAVVSVLGIPLWYPVNSPRTVITPGINPGECWAFQNFPAFLVIKLSNKVKIEAFSFEHISKLLVPNGKIDSAPKDFEVYGLKGENDRDPILLGKFEYDYDGEPLQHFIVNNEGQVFDMIELRIISNHGNPNYTCLYRFRVHGKVSHENT